MYGTANYENYCKSCTLALLQVKGYVDRTYSNVETRDIAICLSITALFNSVVRVASPCPKTLTARWYG